MEAADQSAREKKGYGDGLTQALTPGRARALRPPRCLPRQPARDRARCSCSCSGSFGVLAACVTAYYEYRGRDRAPRRGEAVGTTHAVESADRVSYEGQIAGDLVRRVLIVSPCVILVAASVSGVDGAVSAAIGLVLVAATSSSRPHAHHLDRPAFARRGDGRGARRLHRAPRRCCSASPSRSTASRFIDIRVLVLTVAVVHLALLIWETRHVSLTLGYPGLKPGVGS